MQSEILEFMEMAKEEQMIQFSQEVEDIKTTHKMSYLEAMQAVCEKYQIDEESVTSFISPQLMDAIRVEAVSLRLVKETGVTLQL